MKRDNVFMYTATKLMKIQRVRCEYAARSGCRIKQARYNNFVF